MINQMQEIYYENPTLQIQHRFSLDSESGKTQQEKTGSQECPQKENKPNIKKEESCDQNFNLLSIYLT